MIAVRHLRSARIAIVSVAVLVVSGCGSSAAGERLPDVAIEPLDDEPVLELRDLDGPAVVNLWATWCAPCLREIPAFERVHQNAGDTVRFVGINVGEDAAAAAGFVGDVGATYDQYLDPGAEVASQLGVTTMPVTVVIDTDGRISTHHTGEMSQSELEAAIAAAGG